MLQYSFCHNGIQIIRNNGSVLFIYFTRDSGKVFYRYKTGTVIGIKHPGIYLGTDDRGNGYFLHNHYQHGRAVITTQQDFAQGQPLQLYHEKCSNSPLDVIRIGLNEVLRGQPYHLLTYNCQTYTNTACHNRQESEDVTNWIKGLALGSLVAAGIGLLIAGSRR